MAGVLQAGAGAAHSLGDADDGFILADDALVEFLLHVEETGSFLLSQPRDRYAGPHGDDFGDVFLGNLGAFLVAVGFPLSFQVAHVFREVQFAVAQFGGDFVLLGSDGFVLFLADALQDCHGVLHFLGSVAAPEADAGTGFVQKVDGLVGQEAVGNVTGGQRCRSLHGVVGNLSTLWCSSYWPLTPWRMSTVISGSGSSTRTGCSRRSNAGSRSTYLR